VFIRKFYNTDAPAEVTTGSGGIAAAMARSGRLVQPGEEGQAPTINTEKKEEPSTAPATPAPAIVAAPAEMAKPEPPKPTKEVKKEEPQTVAPAVQPSWQEVLKSQQPDNILKELGYGENLVKFLNGKKDLDPKMLGLIDHWEKNDGNVEPYLRALATDFSKMKPEDVMRYQLQTQNPELDAKQIDRLYKLKVVDRYKLDPVNFSEDEVSDGQIELLADVKPIRAALAEQQQSLLLPKPAPKAEAPNNEQQQDHINGFKTYINEHPYIKNLLTNKKISFGEGEEAFDFEVEPDHLVELMVDGGKWAENINIKHELPNGSVKYSPDVEKQTLLSLIASSKGKAFLNSYADHFKKIGGKLAIAPIENAKLPSNGEPSKSPAAESSPAAAAAKRGRLVSGGQ